MRRLGFASFALCLLLTSPSAQAAPSPEWGESTMAQITKGESQEQIVALLGEPVSRKVGLGGSEVWVYEKSASGHKALNAWMAIASVGMIRGSYVDVLTVTFANGKVADATYQANVSPASSNNSW